MECCLIAPRWRGSQAAVQNDLNVRHRHIKTCGWWIWIYGSSDAVLEWHELLTWARNPNIKDAKSKEKIDWADSGDAKHSQPVRVHLTAWKETARCPTAVAKYHYWEGDHGRLGQGELTDQTTPDSQLCPSTPTQPSASGDFIRNCRQMLFCSKNRRLHPKWWKNKNNKTLREDRRTKKTWQRVYTFIGFVLIG